MSETTPNIIVPAGLHISIACRGCRHLSQGLCDRPEGDEHILGLTGTTITKDQDVNSYLSTTATCSKRDRIKFGACVALTGIEWEQDEEEMDDSSEYPEDTEYFCPAEQIIFGWTPVTYAIKGNELVMVDNNAS